MLTPHHIAITGASSGLGAALALEYAASGRLLSLHGRDAARLGEVADKARLKGATVHVQVGDVTDEGAMADWIAAADQLQPVDLLIANAGISGGTGGRGDNIQQTRAIFAVNLDGVLNTVQPALPLMAQRQHGQIAIVSSLAGFRGLLGSAAYCASKAAVRVYGEALRAEYAPRHVAVNVICPGFIKTPMTDVNRFKMPFLISAQQAAATIRHGLEANRPRIAFPWQLYTLVRVFSSLPQSLLDFLSQSLPKK